MMCSPNWELQSEGVCNPELGQPRSSKRAAALAQTLRGVRMVRARFGQQCKALPSDENLYSSWGGLQIGRESHQRVVAHQACTQPPKVLMDATVRPREALRLLYLLHVRLGHCSSRVTLPSASHLRAVNAILELVISGRALGFMQHHRSR